ncbi:MAG: helix-turn-helix transcriptional regulator [Candidatus Korobacteraceae bacterium]
MTRVSEMHNRWVKDPKYRTKYEALRDEFALANAVIESRKRAGLTQQQLAQKMGTTQPVVARLEAGNRWPSLRTLERLANATGSRLVISFEPQEEVKKQVIASRRFEVTFRPAQTRRKTG